VTQIDSLRISVSRPSVLRMAHSKIAEAVVDKVWPGGVPGAELELASRVAAAVDEVLGQKPKLAGAEAAMQRTIRFMALIERGALASELAEALGVTEGAARMRVHRMEQEGYAFEREPVQGQRVGRPEVRLRLVSSPKAKR
jgi:hypothetical protein